MAFRGKTNQLAVAVGHRILVFDLDKVLPK